MNQVVRLRRYGHEDCEHDIPVDVTMEGLPDVGDLIAAPIAGESLFIVRIEPLEAPVGPARHSSEALGLPSLQCWVIRVVEQELISAALTAILTQVREGVFLDDEDDADDDPGPLIH